MNRRLSIISLTLLLLTISCAKEQESQVTNEQGVRVQLRFETFNTKATVDSEEAVNRVRIIIFGSESSSDKGKLLCNKLAYPDSDGYIAPVIITTGVRDIYVIVNEAQGEEGETLAEYANIATVAHIEALKLAYVGTTSALPYRPSEIPMFVRHLNRNIYVNKKNETNSDIERMMSKVTLNLNVKNSNFTPDRYPVIKTITIKNLPEHSYYVAKPYVGTLTTSEVQTAAAAATVATGYDYSSTNTFYVPEYILSNINEGAYLEIKGHINGEAETKEIKWIVKVGDAMAPNQQFGDRYDIPRNRHYTFTGDVKSYGEHDIDIQVNVSPWNKLTSESEAGEYLLVNSSVVNLKHTIANVDLKVFSNNLQTLKVNYDPKKLSKPVIDLTSGVVTIKAAIYDYKIDLLEDNWTTITIEQGRFKKTIQVNYEPIVWAPGDIVIDEAGRFAIGWLGHGRTLLFMHGSNIGIGFAHGPTDLTSWTNTSFYYTPNPNPAVAAAKNSGMSVAGMAGYTAVRPDDPCASVYHPLKWRTPTKEEFMLLNVPIGKRAIVNLMPIYTFSAFKNTDGSDVALFSHFLSREPSGVPGGLTGYYWSSTPNWLFIADNYADTRIHFLPREYQLKVRCVRNFH